MSLRTLLDLWQTSPAIRANVTARQTFPARSAQCLPFPDDIHPALSGALRDHGVYALYTHQAATWQHVQEGGHVVVVTSTASGKTLCYNLPVLDRLLRNPRARALYLFPTKALAQDQKNALLEVIPIQGEGQERAVRVATYDGDTPSAARAAIRTQARVLLTNPDMLHTGILPHHTLWAEFFGHLCFVVVDEVHTYRGVFGSHVANVLRRLKRIARFYGSSPQFILTSATIANPVDLAEHLIGETVSLVENDGAPRCTRHFWIYNPPIVNPDIGLRRSALQESARLAFNLLEHDVQIIVFARTRRSVELLLTYLREAAASSLPRPGPQVRGYRSGYLPRQRRAIEGGLRQGQVRAVVATTALELGVDIGGMGTALLAGYPGTIAGTWQQAGRAGRRPSKSDDDQETSLAVLVASADPLDQFLAHHPDYFFGRSPERALIDPDNPLILLDHVRCAAFELPFRIDECFGTVDGTHVAGYLAFLEEAGVVHHSGDRYYWMSDRYPAGDISLRAASPEVVLLQSRDDEGGLVGQVDLASAYWMVHPGAVYLHEGKTYLVDELDLNQHVAQLRPADVDYYTQARTETTVQLIEQRQESRVPGAVKGQGEISVTSQVTGYRRIRWFTNEELGQEDLSLPPTELRTTAYWFTPTTETIARLRQQGMWRNDPNDYGPDWQKQRDRARARDRYCCQNCGTPERGRAHHVHHKTPFRAFPSPRQANTLDNLITLCPRCHARAELAVRVRSGLSGLAFALSHLAPLYLMCDLRDLGVDCDPQSPLTKGQPTIAIYDQVPAGIGLSERLFELHQTLMDHTCELVASCACAEGCPSCIGPAGEDGMGGKRETLAILQMLLTPRSA